MHNYKANHAQEPTPEQREAMDLYNHLRTLPVEGEEFKLCSEKLRKLREQENEPKITVKEVQIPFEALAQYELLSSWWSGWVPFEWLNELTAAYYVAKAKRKYKRYSETMLLFQEMGIEITAH